MIDARQSTSVCARRIGCGTAKFAGVVGDGARVAMGALLGPGILVGRASVLYPGVVLSTQLIPEGVVVKLKQTQIVAERWPSTEEPARQAYWTV